MLTSLEHRYPSPICEPTVHSVDVSASALLT